MNALTTSMTPDRYNQARHVTKKDLKPVSLRHRFVLELHLAGVKVRDRRALDGTVIPGIMTWTGFSEAMIYRILGSDNVIALRQQLMQHLDKEFEAQYHKVVDAVDKCLDENQPAEIKLKAAKLWGEYHKKFQKEDTNTTLNITAEDIVVQIMNGDYIPPEHKNE